MKYEKKNFKSQFFYGRCIVPFPAKSEIQRVFRILPNGIKIWKKSTIQKVLRTLIWHIINFRKVIDKLVKKKLFNKKPVTYIFSAKIDSSICPNTYEFFQIFF